MRDTFGGGPLSIGASQGNNERGEDYFHDGLAGPDPGLKRQRSSFSLSQGHHSSPGAAPPSYGHAT